MEEALLTMSEEAAMMISALVEEMVRYAVAKAEKKVRGYVIKRNGKRAKDGNKMSSTGERKEQTVDVPMKESIKIERVKEEEVDSEVVHHTCGWGRKKNLQYVCRHGSSRWTSWRPGWRDSQWRPP